MIDIDLKDYDYELPEERIAQYPLKERDASRLLVYDGNTIRSEIFRNLPQYIRPGSLLVFNNTKVIRARLLFSKESGANIEILCLEPVRPSDYESSFSSIDPVEWKCLAGNLKKWKDGPIFLDFEIKNKKCRLVAENSGYEDEALRIRFTWGNQEISFGEVIEAAGHIPLPPYISRSDEPADGVRYQTIYSSIRGSVAAPTAGLHFTRELLGSLKEKGIRKTELTMHIGAGTFQPVRSANISGHEMHSENFVVTRSVIQDLISYAGSIVAVGTTSLRCLESLYWMGLRAIKDPFYRISGGMVDQWEPYYTETQITTEESLRVLLDTMKKGGYLSFKASTKLIIVPGYKFRIAEGLITNFHQPRSTLLLLVSAWIGPEWKKIYKYAIESGFRFLSYGDSSLLFKQK